MQKAIDETDRRRKLQAEYNKEHGITPKSIIKKVSDVMERSGESFQGNKDRRRKVAEAAAKYDVHNPAEMVKAISKLEKQMYKHAKDLEFEEAAAVRDTIEQLRDGMLKPDAGKL